MVVGLLSLHVHLPRAHSLKDKRAVLNRLKAQLRKTFNVAVAEVDATEKWQRATIGISAVGDQRVNVEGVLRQVTEWMSLTNLIVLSSVEEEYR